MPEPGPRTEEASAGTWYAEPQLSSISTLLCPANTHEGHTADSWHCQAVFLLLLFLCVTEGVKGHGVHLPVVDPESHGNALLASECLALFTSPLGGRASLCHSDTNYMCMCFFLESGIQFKSNLTTISRTSAQIPKPYSIATHLHFRRRHKPGCHLSF